MERKSIIRRINKITSTIAITMALCVILLHAVVPHHHYHDGHGHAHGLELVCEEEWLETGGECTCGHCDGCTHEHKHHGPFSCCHLQDLLSQLVITSEDDKILPQIIATAAPDTLLTLWTHRVSPTLLPTPAEQTIRCATHRKFLPTLYRNHTPKASGLRAPPFCI